MKVNLKDLHRGDVIAGICAAVAACAVFALFAGVALGLGAGVLTGYAVAVTRHRYMAALQARVERSDGPDWDVELNGVKVGRISDSKYAAVRLQVFEDWRLYVAQLLNCGRVLLRVLDSMLMVAPVLVFWGLLAVAILSPGYCTEVLNELRTVTPAAIASFASLLLTAMMTVGLLSAGLSAALTGARFGFVNRFGEETTRTLRRLLCVAAEGDVVLVRWVDGVREINDERSTLTSGA
jgi:hypothetical protein